MIWANRSGGTGALQGPQGVDQRGLPGGFLVLCFDLPGGDACHYRARLDIVYHDGPGGNDSALADMDPFDHDGVGTDEHIVLNDDRRRTGRFDDACQDSARADMAVFADGRAPAQDSAHVDHGACTDDRADVDDRAHHNDGVIADLDIFPDDRARLDAGVDGFEVQHGDGGITAVVLNDQLGDIARVGFQHWADVLPVAEDDLRPRPGSKHLGVREFDWLGLL